MTAPIRRQYTYYRCTKKNSPNCRQRVVSREDLESQIMAFLGSVDISDRSYRWAMHTLDELRVEKLKNLVPVQDARRRGVQEYQQQLDNLTRLYTSPRNAERSLLSDEEYERQRFALLKEKSTMADDPTSERDRLLRDIDSVATTLTFARELQKRFTNGDAKTKRAILTSIGSNLSLKDKILCLEPLIPFRIMKSDLPWLRRFEPGIEPSGKGLPAGDFGTSTRAITTLSGRPIEVRTFRRKWRALILKILHAFESDQNAATHRPAA